MGYRLKTKDQRQGYETNYYFIDGDTANGFYAEYSGGKAQQAKSSAVCTSALPRLLRQNLEEHSL